MKISGFRKIMVVLLLQKIHFETREINENKGMFIYIIMKS